MPEDNIHGDEYMDYEEACYWYQQQCYLEEQKNKSKPRHKEPTNWEHCCSCCSKLEKENKLLKDLVRNMRKGSK